MSALKALSAALPVTRIALGVQDARHDAAFGIKLQLPHQAQDVAVLLHVGAGDADQARRRCPSPW